MIYVQQDRNIKFLPLKILGYMVYDCTKVIYLSPLIMAMDP